MYGNTIVSTRRCKFYIVFRDSPAIFEVFLPRKIYSLSDDMQLTWDHPQCVWQQKKIDPLGQISHPGISSRVNRLFFVILWHMENHQNCCHQMSYFEAEMHQSWFPRWKNFLFQRFYQSLCGVITLSCCTRASSEPTIQTSSHSRLFLIFPDFNPRDLYSPG